MSKKYSKDELSSNQEKRSQAFDGDLTSFAAMLGDSFKMKIDWLAQLLHDTHYPSLGVYKERLLKSVILDFIPKRFEVGTGFIFFPRKDLYRVGGKVGSSAVQEISNQLDLIVYNASDYPVIFRDQDFVVVRPEAVHAVIEVKGSLDSEAIDETLDSFKDLGMKWKRCRKFYSDNSLPSMPIPRFLLMAWAVAYDKKGYPKTDGERLRKRIVEKYKEVPKAEIPGFPTLSAAYIYDDCCVHKTDLICNEGLKHGYSTSRGRFIRYNDDNNPMLAGDKTIASLLSYIQFSLDTPFNSAISHVDQTNREDILPHKYAGFECWLHGEDTKLISG